MAKIKVVLPAMGEGIIEATITQWLKQVNEEVEADEPIVEIATDKVDSEIPSPAKGKLTRQLFDENDIPKVGDTIAVIEVGSTDGIDPTLILTEQEKTIKFDVAAAPKTSPFQNQQKIEETGIISKSNRGNMFLSPLVKSIIQKEGIPSGSIEKIDGTGLNGRITKDDILRFLNTPQETYQDIPEPAKTKPHKAHQLSLPGDEIIEMSRMRKLIADHMVESKSTSPHVTSFIEADVTSIVNWRQKNKDAFQEKHGQKLTYTTIFTEAVIKAIGDFPLINSSVEKNKIIKHNKVNIGMATALPSGDLIVPVIKSANEKNLIGLAKNINDLANRARLNKLLPDEIQGGTFTITNVGTFNNISGTPIINQPQVAILALGAIKKKPAVIETPSGDTIGIRHIMVLSLSYDHRIVDGALGGMFLNRIAEYMEQFNENQPV